MQPSIEALPQTFPDLPGDWYHALADECQQPYYKTLQHFLEQEWQHATVYPPAASIFTAFNETSLQSVKVVILGQDPYHGPRQAHGLAFSVNHGVAIPPSLRNIYKELASDLGIQAATHGHLTAWAKQGVLMLNTVLTVRANSAHSHRDKGWEIFTDKVIQVISRQHDSVVFVLWGAHAKSKQNLIDTKKHCVLTAPHPSPFSANRGFLGCRHFSKINDFLHQRGRIPIDWQLP